MINSKCVIEKKDSKIKVEQLGRKAVFRNAKKDKYSVVTFDGCVVVQSLAADYIVTKLNVGSVIVELKGSDVEHGIGQIGATVDYLAKEGGLCSKVKGALIVCSQYPRASSSFQVKLQKFVRAYQVPLHVSPRNMEYNFEDLMRFDVRLK
mgnify:CR=1 FL=1